MMDSDLSFFPLIALSAATLAGGLVVLQSDRVSRRILDHNTLEQKRRGEYMYQWKTVMEKTKLQLDYYFAGGIEAFKADPECVMKKTEYVSDESAMDALIQQILDKKDQTFRFYTIKIDQDPHDPTDDYFLFMAKETTKNEASNGTGSIQLYELPLVKFGTKLALAFENQLTTTTLCFVADASAGKASALVESLVQEAKSGVAVVSEPFWMVQLAGLSEASVLSSAKIQKLLFALCRLDAWSVREKVGDAKTVMFTLPGQATVATLLPLVQQVFPEDRHVFAYDGCVSSVQRALYAKRQFKRGQLQTRLTSIIYRLCQDPIRNTTPFPAISPLTKDATLSTLSKALSKVPLQQAQVVETWMSSVDAYFKLKQQETTNGYVPFCFKMGFITDNSDGNFEIGTDSFWSLTALLQFITGKASRALPEGVVDAAKEWLKDYNQQEVKEQELVNKTVVVSDDDEKRIENCCFQHKLILIGNKTLQDTVLPKQHWTLKQATRAGCSCCGPDPYEQMEEEEEARDGDEYKNDRSLGIDMNSPGAFAMAFKTDNGSATVIGGSNVTNRATKTGYVDGKMGYAFDPTRF